jgi:hypothetical protein
MTVVGSFKRFLTSGESRVRNSGFFNRYDLDVFARDPFVEHKAQAEIILYQTKYCLIEFLAL